MRHFWLLVPAPDRLSIRENPDATRPVKSATEGPVWNQPFIDMTPELLLSVAATKSFQPRTRVAT
jgi:hypothetical protein